MTEKAIGTVTESAEAIATAVSKTGLGTRGLVIAGSFMLATGIGIGAKFAFNKAKRLIAKKNEIEVVEEQSDNVTDISEAITNLAEENDN